MTNVPNTIQAVIYVPEMKGQGGRLIPVIKEITPIANPNYLWYILVFAGAAGGGWTPFGSAAGILAVALLAKEKRPLSFKRFLKVKFPIAMILLALSYVYATLLAILGFI